MPTTLVLQYESLFTIIYLTGNKELRLIMISVHGKVLFEVPRYQGSVLGPILFNIFLSNLLLVMNKTEFTNHEDDNSLYDAGNTIEDVISSLHEFSKKLFKWVSDN